MNIFYICNGYPLYVYGSTGSVGLGKANVYKWQSFRWKRGEPLVQSGGPAQGAELFCHKKQKDSGVYMHEKLSTVYELRANSTLRIRLS